jgi:chitinase
MVINGLANISKVMLIGGETRQMLNLITHAGVPSNKVLLGIATYGRSFKQQNPNCYEESCKFTGPNSGAIPGKCTGTSGYLALAEIKDIVKTQNVRKHYPDNGHTTTKFVRDL